MHRSIVLALVAISAIGCGGGEAPEGDVGAAALPQITPDVFLLLQDGATVGSAWKGTITGGATVEFWVSGSAYDAGAARTFTPTGAQSCESWRKSVCDASWASSRYY